MYHTESEIRLLPDTPMNRRLLQRWSEQDERGLRSQRTLFSKKDEPDPRTPAKEDPRRDNETAEVTFRIQPEESEQDELTQDQSSVDREIISRMIAGSSRARMLSGSDISEQIIGTINIQLEFPKVFELKKNKCASVISFVAWVKKHEDFKWPVDETGDALREVLSKLAMNLMTEFLTPPKLVAAIQMFALFASKFHKSVFVSDFHSGMCHNDTAFGKFMND
jgi:hypothetical protein